VVSELVWTQRLEKKYFASAGDRTPVVQSVVNHLVSTVINALLPQKAGNLLNTFANICFSKRVPLHAVNS
jgi:hypothetical protein